MTTHFKYPSLNIIADLNSDVDGLDFSSDPQLTNWEQFIYYFLYSSSPPCSVFLVFWQYPSICISFYFLSFSLCGLLDQSDKIFFCYLTVSLTLQPEPGRCPCVVMVKAMDCGIVVSEFELQLRYYVHFRTNTLGKGMNPLILSAMV